MTISRVCKKTLLLALPAVALCGCDDSLPGIDDDGVEQSAESRIEIAGGTPEDPVLASRAVSEPSRPGYCEANMLRIWTYRGVTYTTHTPSVADMMSLNESVEIPVSHYSGENNCNKWTSYTVGSCKADGYRNTGFAMPSLAYSAADKDAFKVDVPEEYTGLKLSLTGTATPELYFGRLHFEAYNDKKENQVREADDGVFYIHNAVAADEYKNCPVTGKLYRIVGQLNVAISDVDVSIVEKMEMYLSNIPTGLTLYGNHGAFYPTASATAHSTTGDILVASADDFSDGNANLSTFLLPSAEGRSMKIRVYYVDGDVVDEDGNKLTYKDYEIRPSKSSFLTGDDAEVYYAGAAEHLRHGSDLYIYNGTDNLFYSYANVRVNISGDFDKIFAETTVTDVRIDVCPSFEKSHDFIIN